MHEVIFFNSIDSFDIHDTQLPSAVDFFLYHSASTSEDVLIKAWRTMKLYMLGQCKVDILVLRFIFVIFLLIGTLAVFVPILFTVIVILIFVVVILITSFVVIVVFSSQYLIYFRLRFVDVIY